MLVTCGKKKKIHFEFREGAGKIQMRYGECDRTVRILRTQMVEVMGIKGGSFRDKIRTQRDKQEGELLSSDCGVLYMNSFTNL